MRCGGTNGPPCYANFSQLKRINFAPRHLEMNFPIIMWAQSVANLPKVLNSGLEMNIFLPHFDPKKCCLLAF